MVGESRSTTQIARDCAVVEKRPIQLTVIEKIVDEIERELQETGEKRSTRPLSVMLS